MARAVIAGSETASEGTRDATKKLRLYAAPAAAAAPSPPSIDVTVESSSASPSTLVPLGFCRPLSRSPRASSSRALVPERSSTRITTLASRRRSASSLAEDPPPLFGLVGVSGGCCFGGAKDCFGALENDMPLRRTENTSFRRFGASTPRVCRACGELCHPPGQPQPSRCCSVFGDVYREKCLQQCSSRFSSQFIPLMDTSILHAILLTLALCSLSFPVHPVQTSLFIFTMGG